MLISGNPLDCKDKKKSYLFRYVVKQIQVIAQNFSGETVISPQIRGFNNIISHS